MRNTITCMMMISLFLVLNSCSTFSPKQTAQKLPENYIIHNDCALVRFPVSYDANGYNKKESSTIINTYLYPMIFISEKTNTKAFKCTYSRDLDSINMKLDLLADSILSMRKYYLAEGSTGFSVPSAGGADGKYKSLFEYNLTVLNPQYVIQYQLLNPLDLLRIYLRGNSDNYQTYVLFTKELYAPEMFYEYFFIEGNSSFDVKTPIVFGNAKGTMSQTASRNLSNRFTLRKYNNSDKAILVLNSGKGMFTEISLSDENGYKEYSSNNTDKIRPDELIISYDNKKYILTKEYADHLESEGVYFIYLKNNALSIKPDISIMNNNEFLSWFKKTSKENPKLISEVLKNSNYSTISTIPRYIPTNTELFDGIDPQTIINTNELNLDLKEEILPADVDLSVFRKEMERSLSLTEIK